MAVAEDEEVLRAIKSAIEHRLVEPILIGDRIEVEKIADRIGLDLTGVKLMDIKDKLLAARKATQLVNSGEADILMKGLVDTSVIMRQVLDKEIGLRTDRLISHGSIFEVATYHKIFLVSDAAMNIAPNLEQKKNILNNVVELALLLGNDNPKVAVLASKEKVSNKMEATVHAKQLAEMNRKGDIIGCIVDGPFALDNAISKEAALTKGISSDVAGDADVLLVPHIDAGNILYKSLVFLAKAKSAGIILGTKAPIVLTSRADDGESKLYSIALGVISASK